MLQNENTIAAITLTKREKQMIWHIADGFTDAAIAEKLSISINTVSTHRKKILRKLNVKNSAHLVKKACLMGLIQ